MSALHAIERHEAPEAVEEEGARRHLVPLPRPRIRRAPRVLHGVVALAGLAAIILGQLGLSIAIGDGAYRISALQVATADLGRTEQALQERLEVRSSPQQVAAGAEDLGMVQGQASQFLQLSTGTVLGGPDALHMQDAAVDGAGASIVANDLVQRSERAESVAAADRPVAPVATDPEPYPGMLLPAEGVAAD